MLAVYCTPEATESFFDLVIQIEERLGLAAASVFVKKTHNVLDLIVLFPEMYKSSSELAKMFDRV